MPRPILLFTGPWADAPLDALAAKAGDWGYQGPTPGVVADALRRFAAEWNPVLDAARECGVRFACEVHPGQLAFDLYSAEAVLDALHGREEFGFTFDPSHLFWQGIDPAAF